MSSFDWPENLPDAQLIQELQACDGRTSPISFRMLLAELLTRFMKRKAQL